MDKPAPAWGVICLCAEWCDTCRQYRSAFDRLAADWPHARFLWVDIETEEDTVGDVEIETFPTLLIAHGPEVHFFGPLPPHIDVLRRLMQEATPSAIPKEVAWELWQRIQKSPRWRGCS